MFKLKKCLCATGGCAQASRNAVDEERKWLSKNKIIEHLTIIIMVQIRKMIMIAIMIFITSITSIVNGQTVEEYINKRKEMIGKPSIRLERS